MIHNYMPETDDRLQPCPFCGSNAGRIIAQRYPDGKIRYNPIVNHKRGCQLEQVSFAGGCLTKRAAIQKWNRRARSK